MTAFNLGAAYKDAGRLAEAIPLIEECHAAGKKHPELYFVPFSSPDGAGNRLTVLGS